MNPPLHSPTLREQTLYGPGVEILSRQGDETVYRILCEDGDLVMTSYQVFPGIELIYNDIHTARHSTGRGALGGMLEIRHCREGRIECQVEDAFFYLTPGDLSIHCKEDAGQDSYFPLSHYHGITVLIDLQNAPGCLSCFLDDVNVRPAALAEKYCGGDGFFVARSKPWLEHIFSELYNVPHSIRQGYFKVKILELLLFLSGMELGEDETRQRSLPRGQVALAKEVCAHLADHMDSRITTAQLADRFHVSQTALKNSFKGVYGVSIYAYIREQKMQAAALLLRDTGHSVLEIAGRFGYDNASKFAGAFRTVMGVSPHEYRTQHHTAALPG